MNGCYAKEMMSHHWDFYGNEIPCSELGFVQLSNSLLMAPDGLSFQDNQGMIGQAFMKTTSAAGQHRNLTPLFLRQRQQHHLHAMLSLLTCTMARRNLEGAELVA